MKIYYYITDNYSQFYNLLKICLYICIHSYYFQRLIYIYHICNVRDMYDWRLSWKTDLSISFLISSVDMPSLVLCALTAITTHDITRQVHIITIQQIKSLYIYLPISNNAQTWLFDE